jgi:hypothetical protein
MKILGDSLYLEITPYGFFHGVQADVNKWESLQTCVVRQKQRKKPFASQA